MENSGFLVACGIVEETCRRLSVDKLLTVGVLLHCRIMCLSQPPADVTARFVSQLMAACQDTDYQVNWV